MNVVFDVDGVIIDTREQVHEAYARVGVTMPPAAFIQSWKQWLPGIVGAGAARNIHARKTREYLEVLKEMPPKVLPAGRMLREYRGAGIDYYAMTSGSEESVLAALTSVDLGFVPVLGYELTGPEKNDILRNKFAKSGVYVDDNIHFRLTAPGWAVVRYSDQGYTQLIDDIWAASARGRI